MVGGVGPRQEMFYSVDYKLPRKPGDGYSAGWDTHSGIVRDVLAPLCKVYGCLYSATRHSHFMLGGGVRMKI